MLWRSPPRASACKRPRSPSRFACRAPAPTVQHAAIVHCPPGTQLRCSLPTADGSPRSAVCTWPRSAGARPEGPGAGAGVRAAGAAAVAGCAAAAPVPAAAGAGGSCDGSGHWAVRRPCVRLVPGVAARPAFIQGAGLPACMANLCTTPCCCRRYDQFNVRLRLAVFEGAASARYRLVSLAHSSSSGAGAEPPRSTGVYRGPRIEHLQPGGITRAADGECSIDAKPPTFPPACTTPVTGRPQPTSTLPLRLPPHLQAPRCMRWGCWMCPGCPRAAPACWQETSVSEGGGCGCCRHVHHAPPRLPGCATCSTPHMLLTACACPPSAHPLLQPTCAPRTAPTESCVRWWLPPMAARRSYCCRPPPGWSWMWRRW